MRVFLSMIFIMGFTLPAFCGVGNVDNRKYVNWNSDPYNKFVLFQNPTGSCTAQYVAPNIILTAAHCLKKTASNSVNNIQRNDGRFFELTLLKDGWSGLTDRTSCSKPNDWAIFKIEDPDGYSSDFFRFDSINQPNVKRDVISGGFGALRILSREEIEKINQAIQANEEELLKSIKINVSKFSNLLQDLITQPPYSITEPLFGDGTKFKAEPCTVQLQTNLDGYNGYGDKPMLSSTCDIWGGNSGGAVIDQTTHEVYGVAHCSDLFHFGGNDNSIDGTFVPTSEFKSELESIIRSNPQKSATEPEIIEPQPERRPPAETIPTLPQIKLQPEDLIKKDLMKPEDIHYLEERLETQDQELQEMIPDLRNLLQQGRLLQFLGKLADREETADRLEKLKKQYEEAKANEQSFSNRALTAASVAATGLGTMAAFSAYSEQQADKEAEQDMSNWLATMSCEYGNHQQVKAGNEEISLPGGDLFDYYNEYKQLADRLKTTKTALGLRKGIESEVLYEQAQTGLYQNSNIGKTGGAYTSLARAMTDKEGEDATAWAEQKQDSKTKLWEGVAAAGVGVVGGAVVNYLINGDESASFDGLGFGGNRNKNGTNNNNNNNSNNNKNENDDETAQLLSSASTVSDASGQHGSKVSPSNQVSAVLVCPWNWLFSSTDSTTFDGATRTVKGKSVTAEETMAYDVQHIKDFLNLDKTNAKTQCVTVDARPVDMAQRVLDHYINGLKDFKPEITIEYQLNQRGIYNCAKDATVCDDIFVHVYNRPCGGKLAGKRKAK